jgi:hypothetical protein
LYIPMHAMLLIQHAELSRDMNTPYATMASHSRLWPKLHASVNTSTRLKFKQPNSESLG